MTLSWTAARAMTRLDGEPMPEDRLVDAWADTAGVQRRTAARWLRTARRLGVVVARAPGWAAPVRRTPDVAELLEGSAYLRLVRALVQSGAPPEPSDVEGVLADLGLWTLEDRTAAVRLGRRLRVDRPHDHLPRPDVLLELARLRARDAPSPVVPGPELFAVWRKALGEDPDVDARRFGDDCVQLYKRRELDVLWAQYPDQGVRLSSQVATPLGYVAAVVPTVEERDEPIPQAGHGAPPTRGLARA